MPRDLPLGNGSLLVNFDASYQLRDLYWPRVGQENQTAGHPFRFGVWVDGQFHWIDDPSWERTLGYAQDTLTSQIRLVNEGIFLRLDCADVVDFHENIYLRKITVTNMSPVQREVRLFFHQDFHISYHAIGDSAYYEPERLAVYHYKGKRWFLINTAKELDDQWILGVDQWAVGTKEAQQREGTWRDAEDGLLSGNAAAQGSVDSCIALHLSVPAQGTRTGWYWIAVGEDFLEVTRLNRLVRERGPQAFLHRTSYYWGLWVAKEEEDFSPLPAHLRDEYRRSLLILRTQIDNGGGILAANDYDVARYYSDTYSYVWPRDGALVAATLIDAGYAEVPQRFFTFCHQAITKEGYLLHKYNPDGSLASSWHGWYNQGHKELPIQEDETALVLWALWRHFARFRDVEYLKPLFRGLIVRAADWMVSYRDTQTGLPLPSWDIWEERRGIFPWTVSATWGGLQAAANFSEAFGEYALAEKYRQSAEAMRDGLERYLWSPEHDCYMAQVITSPDFIPTLHPVIESSLFGLWYFGMLPADAPRIVASMHTVRDRLSVRTAVGGVARYEHDLYHRTTSDASLPGNPWFICTLWLAQWYIAVAKNLSALEPALALLNWAATHALHSGVMAEQVDPYTGAPLSVSPLTWSHATFVLAVREYQQRLRTLT